ncbi:TMV resistance protein N-like [Nymphaea colorata]|nr:TMV resistance protein N-like [Nymphaea colorata]
MGALAEAGKISGYTLAATNGYEGKLIQVIVKRILTEVNKTSLFVAKHPVGLDCRLADLMEVLDVESQDLARIVGIHSMGGMGKTTLAKAVYNQISSRFDACSFISNIREVANQALGLISLQKQLLYDVFKDENVKISSISDGIGKIIERIRGKKVLLVLDDIDNKSQLDALAGDLDWFCSGSRIIITTRYKHVLKAPRLKHNEDYELKQLDSTQSLQLFSWHAFGKEVPDAKFAKLSKEVASAAAGLPLALEIFGSHFFNLKTDKEWQSMLQKLKDAQDKGLHETLKISYDALDTDEKKVFLDIACFFVGQQRELPTLMWEGCGFFPDITIKVLMHESLVSINDDTGEFEMHDHIRDMGRNIVQAERKVGKCSRLWKDDETLDVLQNKGVRVYLFNYYYQLNLI